MGKMMQRMAVELTERCLLCFCVPGVTENKMYSLPELWNILKDKISKMPLLGDHLSSEIRSKHYYKFGCLL